MNASSPSAGGIGRGALAAAAGTGLSRLTGFVRLVALVYALGIAETRLTDTYNLANVLPNIVYELILGGVLSGVLLRMYVEVRDRDGQDEAWLFMSRLTNLALLTLSAVALTGIAAAPSVIRLFTINAPEAERGLQQAVGSVLLMMFIPQIVFYGLNTIATAVLRGHNRFGVLMFSPVLNNLAVTAMLIGFSQIIPQRQRNLSDIPFHGLAMLGLGTTFGVALLGLIPWLYSRRTGRRWSLRAGLWDQRFPRLAKLSAYTLGYVASNMVGLAITYILANRIQGGVTARENAFIMFQLPHGLLAVSISLVMATALTEAAVAEDTEGFKRTLNRGLRAIAFLILPAVAGYIAVGDQVVRALLQHGVVTATSTEFVSSVLKAYAAGLLFFSSWHLLLGGFQALGDTRTPMMINLFGLSTHVGLSLTLFFMLDGPVNKVAGLALAHAVSYMVVASLGLLVLRRRMGRLGLKKLLSTIARTILASIGVGAAALLVSRFTLGPGISTLEEIAGLILTVAAGLLVYALLAKALRMEELSWIKSLLIRSR